MRGNGRGATRPSPCKSEAIDMLPSPAALA